LLRQVNVQRMRGQWLDAEVTCRKALTVAPTDLGTHVMFVDILIELGKTDEALAEIKAALLLAPGNPNLETKYAKLVLQKGEAAYQMAMARDMLENPHKYRTASRRKPGLALFLSLMMPGLGQLYNQEFVKAGILFGTLILLIVSYGLFQAPYPTTVTITDFLKYTNGFVQAIGIMTLGAYIYGIADAVVSANKDENEKAHSVLTQFKS
jgi:TM2 domain-containing membrane protein YozV